jgi:putative tryptophan/tyrosine transport system substrate-binding protein
MPLARRSQGKGQAIHTHSRSHIRRPSCIAAIDMKGQQRTELPIPQGVAGWTPFQFNQDRDRLPPNQCKGSKMRRRDVIMLAASAAALPLAIPLAMPLTARAQQRDRLRRAGMLWGFSENNPESQSNLAAVIQELARLGWVEGRNVRIDQRWTNDDADLAGKFAKELVGLQPDVILSVGSTATAALQRETRTIPIVFASVAEPVEQGFVAGLPRPGGNITGFSYVEPAFIGKLTQMLKEIAPGIRRVAAMYNPDFAAYAKSYLDSFEAAAQVLAVDPIISPVHSDAEIEMAIDALGREHGGLALMPDGFMLGHRAAVIATATRNKVPTIYSVPAFAKEGGLMSYGPNAPEMYRGAAGYVARILKGDKPSDLPVQLPVRYELVINLKTAKALGLTVPNTLLVFADELIEE